MGQAIKLGRFSFGMGDRFGCEAVAQLAACQRAAERGVEVTPVWNKSHREHSTIHSRPPSVREAADAAVAAAGWNRPYFVDADHINRDTVDEYLESSDFFTIDVADAIGQPADGQSLEAFVSHAAEQLRSPSVPDIEKPLDLSRDRIHEVARKYLAAVKRAAAIYRHIAERKGPGTFVTEVSMDETDRPQTPPELLVILFALAQEKVPLQTIAPKFTGRFNKGVDYVGDVAQFEQEFRDDLAVIAFAVQEFALPDNLKLSVHSGSDKFSLYGAIRRAAADRGAGWHVKTAGTTWLEELIGLAEADGSGLEMAKAIYAKAWEQRATLCAPYAAVIDIDQQQLPSPADVSRWSAEQFANGLRHNQDNPLFNPHFRQLLHVAYKVAAQHGQRYHAMLQEHRSSIERNVTANLWQRHLEPLLFGS